MMTPMKSIIALLIMTANAQAFIIPENYESGKDRCLRENLSSEFSKYVSVPVDYNNLSKGYTSIYSYTKKPFNPNLPSIIYFTGGPGSSSRASEFTLERSNVIFLEQRGISCSKPETKELYLDPKFYSSVNTAKDAKLVLDSYGIKKATIYGQSYGTVPATIFASMFKSQTNNLILEGVIFNGNETLWHSPVKKHLLQNFFNQLSSADQEKVLNYSQSGLVPSNWFSKVGGMLLYMNNGIETYKTFLESLLTMDEDTFVSFIRNFYPNEKEAEDFSFGDVTMGMIGCQEISMNNQELSLNLVFQDKKLSYDKVNVDYHERCLPLGLDQYKSNYYRAINYPVFTPVFYFLGENDGATDIHQGMNHFRTVAKSEKTLIILKKGGHLPALGLLKDNRPCNPMEEEDKCQSLAQNVQMTNIFDKIIHREVLEQSDIDKLNRSGELQFKLTNSL